LTLYMYNNKIGDADAKTLRNAFFPFLRRPLWFACEYLRVTMLSPLFNAVIQKCSRKVLEALLFFFFLVQVLFSTITLDGGLFGGEFWPFVTIYLFMGYLKMHCRNQLPSLSTSLILFLVSWMGLILFHTHVWMMPNGPNKKLYEEYAEYYRCQFQSLPNLVTAISLFFVFFNIKIGTSRVINKLASASLGIYAFSQTPKWNYVMWRQYFECEKYKKLYTGAKRGLYVLCSACIIMVVGTILEFIRSWITDYLIENRAWFKTLCADIDSYFNGEEDGLEIEKENVKKSKRTIVICFVFLFIAVGYWVLFNKLG